MVGPIYGQEIGLSQKDIGYFLATVLIGGALAQFPVGYFADKYDRRWVLIWISVLSIAVCAALSLYGSSTQTTIFALAFAFGFTTFPIYSVSTSHANDFAAPEDRMELSASLLFCYAIGAILSPVVAAWIIENFGSAALFTFIATAHVFLVIFGIYRMRARPTSDVRVRYSYMPRTSYLISRLMKRRTIEED
jgi:MFS family permease